MSKKRSHGKIDGLPDSIRTEVENRLVEGHTYAQIAEYLKEMGQNIHLMSVQRYGKPFLERFEAIRMAALRQSYFRGQHRPPDNGNPRSK